MAVGDAQTCDYDMGTYGHGRKCGRPARFIWIAGDPAHRKERPVCGIHARTARTWNLNPELRPIREEN